MTCTDDSTLVAEADGRVFTDGRRAGRIDSDGTAYDATGAPLATLAADGRVALANDPNVSVALPTDEDSLQIQARPSMTVRQDGTLEGIGPAGACSLRAAPEHRRYALYALLVGLITPNRARDEAPEPPTNSEPTEAPQ